MSNEEMEKIEVGAENFKHPESDESVDGATEKAMEVINSESTNSLENPPLSKIFLNDL